jgi:hypothetical protein
MSNSLCYSKFFLKSISEMNKISHLSSRYIEISVVSSIKSICDPSWLFFEQMLVLEETYHLFLLVNKTNCFAFAKQYNEGRNSISFKTILIKLANFKAFFYMIFDLYYPLFFCSCNICSLKSSIIQDNIQITFVVDIKCKLNFMFK